MTARRYVSDHGHRLVTQDGRGVPDQSLAGIDFRTHVARLRGECSVCEGPAHPDSLDASGRCLTCQP